MQNDEHYYVADQEDCLDTLYRFLDRRSADTMLTLHQAIAEQHGSEYSDQNVCDYLDHNFALDLYNQDSILKQLRQQCPANPKTI